MGVCGAARVLLLATGALAVALSTGQDGEEVAVMHGPVSAKALSPCDEECLCDPPRKPLSPVVVSNTPFRLAVLFGKVSMNPICDAASQLQMQGSDGSWSTMYNGPLSTFAVDHLRQDDEVRFRVRERNCAGLGPFSDELEVRTAKQDARPPPPALLSATPRSVCVVVNLTKVGVADIFNASEELSVTFRAAPDPEISGNKSDAYGELSGSVDAATGRVWTGCATGLFSFTPYQFRANVADETLMETMSSVITYTTLPEPPPAPTMPVVEEAGPTSLKLGWSKPKTDNKSPTDVFMVDLVEVDAESGGPSPLSLVQQSANDTNGTNSSSQTNTTWVRVGQLKRSPITMPGLLPGRFYGVRVIAVNSVGESPPSPTLLAATTAMAPAAPANIKFTAATSDSVRVVWDEADMNGSPITEYVLERYGGADAMYDYITVYTGLTTHRRLDKLEPNTFYGFRARANNAKGDGLHSKQIFIKTPMPGETLDDAQLSEASKPIDAAAASSSAAAALLLAMREQQPQQPQPHIRDQVLLAQPPQHAGAHAAPGDPSVSGKLHRGGTTHPHADSTRQDDPFGLPQAGAISDGHVDAPSGPAPDLASVTEQPDAASMIAPELRRFAEQVGSIGESAAASHHTPDTEQQQAPPKQQQAGAGDRPSGRASMVAVESTVAAAAQQAAAASAAGAATPPVPPAPRFDPIPAVESVGPEGEGGPGPVPADNTGPPPPKEPVVVDVDGSCLGSRVKCLEKDPEAQAMHFSCPTTASGPIEIRPAVTDMCTGLNVDQAVYEGATADLTPADQYNFTQTACVCECSGVESTCGAAGDPRFYTGLSTAADCAQLTCSALKFSECKWRGERVSMGVWGGTEQATLMMVSEALEPCSNASLKADCPNGCGGYERGICRGNGTCHCINDWDGADCMGGKCPDRINECGLHGACVAPNTCACSPGYGGLDCLSYASMRFSTSPLAPPTPSWGADGPVSVDPSDAGRILRLPEASATLDSRPLRPKRRSGLGAAARRGRRAPRAAPEPATTLGTRLALPGVGGYDAPMPGDQLEVDFHGNQSFTVSVYFKAENDARTWPYERSSFVQHGDTNGGGGWGLGMHKGGSVYCHVGSLAKPSRASNVPMAVSKGSFADGRFHQLSCIFDLKNGVITLAVDGNRARLQTYWPYTAGSIPKAPLGDLLVGGLNISAYRPSAPLVVGASHDMGGSFFQGWLSEVRIWSVPRSLEQEGADMWDPLKSASSGLSLYLPLSDCDAMLPYTEGFRHHSVRGEQQAVHVLYSGKGSNLPGCDYLPHPIVRQP